MKEKAPDLQCGVGAEIPRSFAELTSTKLETLVYLRHFFDGRGLSPLLGKDLCTDCISD